jgi:glycolate oxidase FAD binding subunit
MTPTDEAGVVAAIRTASEPLAIIGNGSKSAMLRPVQAAATLSTSGLTGVTFYSHNELVISARAGTPVAELRAVVAERGQHLIAEPPELGALLGSDREGTIGGAVATNLSGPRRVAWGAIRDHVMGLTAVNGRGDVLRAGGRVLKNVTGLDFCKLLSGSHGTLAVITEVILKVLPAPERRATLVLKGQTPAEAVVALSAALGSPYAVSGAAWLPADLAARVPALGWLGGNVTLARLEDFAPSVAYRSERLRADLAAFGAVEMLDDAASAAVWADIANVAPLVGVPGGLWKISVRPSRGPAVVAALQAAGANCLMDWGGGLVWVAGPATEATHAAVEGAAHAAGGVWTLMRAPDALRSAVAVIPPEAAALAAIGARVKAAFDPRGILNPGRMVGGV